MKYIIGIDFGATKINTVLIDAEGKVIKKLKVETKKKVPEIINQILESIETVSDKEVTGIGIGVPGILNKERTETLILPNLPGWKTVKLKEIIEKKTQKKVLLENDSNCMALGEKFFGYGKNTDNFICVTLGTGIGGGVVINGNIYKGRGNAGEIGHMAINEKEDMEKYVLSEKKNLKRMGKKLGICLSNIVKVLDPELILIGGGLSNLGNSILEPTKKEMKKRIFSEIPPIKIVKLKDNAGAIGAACLFKT